MTTVRTTQPVLAWNERSDDFSMSESQRFTWEEPSHSHAGLEDSKVVQRVKFYLVLAALLP